MALALFSGCASLPKPEKMKTDIIGYELPQLPEEGKAIVYVVRPSEFGGLIRFNVFVDDKQPTSEMGFTRGSQYIYFNLMPGNHEILSKAENWAKLYITANAGDIIFIQQDAKMGLFMTRNTLSQLPDYQGKYRVKHLELGTIIRANK